jgi:hypothetical protein
MRSQPLLVVGLTAGEPPGPGHRIRPARVLTGFMIADAVRYMSVDSRNQPDSQGHNGTTTARRTTAHRGAYARDTGRLRWWWQVLGSNQRRLSRRFYRPTAKPLSPA